MNIGNRISTRNIRITIVQRGDTEELGTNFLSYNKISNLNKCTSLPYLTVYTV